MGLAELQAGPSVEAPSPAPNLPPALAPVAPTVFANAQHNSSSKTSHIPANNILSATNTSFSVFPIFSSVGPSGGRQRPRYTFQNMAKDDTIKDSMEFMTQRTNLAATHMWIILRVWNPGMQHDDVSRLRRRHEMTFDGLPRRLRDSKLVHASDPRLALGLHAHALIVAGVSFTRAFFNSTMLLLFALSRTSDQRTSG